MLGKKARFFSNIDVFIRETIIPYYGDIMKIDKYFTVFCIFMATVFPPLAGEESAKLISAYTSFATKVSTFNVAIAKANHDVSQAEVLSALTAFADGLDTIVATMRSTAVGRAESTLTAAEIAAIDKAKSAMAALETIPQTFQWCIGGPGINEAWTKIINVLQGS